MKKLKITSLICAMTLSLMGFASSKETLIGCNDIPNRSDCLECCDFVYMNCMRSSNNSQQFCSDTNFFCRLSCPAF